MDVIFSWLTRNYIEIFGAVTGIVYVFLEIRQNTWLWPLGLLTSAVYIWVFFTSKFYADMSLQVYYLIISLLGWYWWTRGKIGSESGSESEGEKRRRSEGERGRMGEKIAVTRVKRRTALVIAHVYLLIHALLWIILARFTDSPVPGWDSFITSLSVVATWMLARKIYEHWYLWVIVNSISAVVFFARGLYPTVVLYTVYCVMSFAGMLEWKKSIRT